MLYPANFEQTAIDRLQDAHDAMVAWLSDQPPEVWLWFAQRGNWDTCVPLFIWMVEQPVCDATVVAALFWEADPLSFATDIRAGAEDFGESEYFELIRTILMAWPAKPRFDDGLKLPNADTAAAYRAKVANEWYGADPLRVPEWLFGPFGAVELPEISQLVASDDHLRNVFRELGMWHGSSPPDQPADASPFGDRIAFMLAREAPEERRTRIATGLILVALSAIGLYLMQAWWLPG